MHTMPREEKLCSYDIAEEDTMETNRLGKELWVTVRPTTICETPPTDLDSCDNLKFTGTHESVEVETLERSSKMLLNAQICEQTVYFRTDYAQTLGIANSM